MSSSLVDNREDPSFPEPPAESSEHGILTQESFRKMISLERKRSERSRKRFLLMLLDTGTQLSLGNRGKLLNRILGTLSSWTRETDIRGWYENHSVVGVMFTEIGIDDKHSILSTVPARVSEALRNNLGSEQFSRINISFHLFPEDWDQETPQHPSKSALYPDLQKRDDFERVYRALKRTMDIAGSSLALILCIPVFLAIAIAIKISSKGPVFFRQQRVGQHGVPFAFLKFRSMYINNDSTVHKEYVRQLIAGQADRKPTNGEANGSGVYKLTDDARITTVGSVLRRTSLDELPQFFHVLTGDMSLVGPRPPLPYEVEAYDIWHRRRVLEAKPGMTGLWQVNGRSRVKFDEMVRLDLRYAKTWSPWLDLKILMRTPKAVFLGEGAY